MGTKYQAGDNLVPSPTPWDPRQTLTVPGLSLCVGTMKSLDYIMLKPLPHALGVCGLLFMLDRLCRGL